MISEQPPANLTPKGGDVRLPPGSLPSDAVFATLVLSPARMLAQFYWQRSQHFGKPLVLVDFDVEPLDGGSWKHAVAYLESLQILRRARLRHPLGLFVESEALAPHVEAAGGTPHIIPRHLSSADGWYILCQSAASLLSRGSLGYTQRAVEQMDARPFLDASGVYAGPRTDDPVVLAFLYGLVLGLDPAAARDPGAKMPKRAMRN